MRRKRFHFDEVTGRISDRQPMGLLDFEGADEVERFIKRHLDIAIRVRESVAFFGWNVAIPDRNPFPRFVLWRWWP